MKNTVPFLQTALLASTNRRTWIPVLAFLVALLAIGVTGFQLFKQHALEVERTAQDGLAAVADLKVRQIVRWMGEQLRDAEVIGRDNLLANEVDRWFQQGTPERVTAQKIQSRLVSLRQVNLYESVVLLDSKARPQLHAGGGQTFDSHDSKLALQAMRKNAVTLSDIHWSDDQKPQMDMIARLAVLGTPGLRMIGAVYFSIDPNVFFFPYIQSWPTKSPSGETVLVRRDGNEVLYLNELRHRKGAALKLRLPFDQPLLVTAMALHGMTGVTEGVDYRGSPVIAAIRKVPDTLWILVAKLDRAEVQVPLRNLAAAMGGMAVLFMLLSGATAVLWWRKQHAQYLAVLAEEKLERLALKQHFDYATKHARDVILLFDDTGRLLECNEAALAAYGYTREELLRLTLSELRAAQARAAIPGDMERAARAGGVTIETINRRKDGSTFPVESSMRRIKVEGRQFYQSIVRDITARRQAEEAISRLAYYDPLTGFPNRTAFREQVQQAVVAGLEMHQPVALLLMDLNRFKEVNETLGHVQGDTLLRQVSQRLRAELFERDVIARLGGDEFGILLPQLTAAEDIRVVINKLLRILETPFIIEGIPIAVEAGIGVAIAPDHATDADGLLQKADVAMYQAKRTGSGHVIYAPERDPYTPQRLALMAELRDAIEHDQLMLHYQPIIDLKTGRPVASEALVRWRHPQKGLIPPDQFIGAAEHTGLIKPLTQWVLNAALRQFQACHREGLSLRVGVNLSARSLHDLLLPDLIAKSLKAADASPEQLKLEITESAVMLDPQRALDNLAALHRMGVLLSIDDFGTGYTSLGHLKALPVNEIKIDQSFVMGILTNEDDAMIVRAIIELSHNLGFKVVAEGVEDRNTLDRLAEMKCDYAQGYFICRPCPMDDFKRWYGALQK